MENSFNDKNFEQFVKQNADQYRIFPSEKVWKGVHNSLHTRRRWYGFGLSFLILTTAVVTWVMLTNSGKNSPVISSLPPFTIQPAQKSSETRQVAKLILTPVKSVNNKLAFVTTTDKLQQDLYIQENNNPVDEANAVAVNINTVAEPANETHSNNLAVFKTQAEPVSDHVIAKAPAIPEQIFLNKPVSVPVTSENSNPDKSLLAESSTKERENLLDELNRNRVNDYPLTIESVVNSYQYIRKKRKTSWEAYITPTISYRDLHENTPFINWARNQANGTVNTTYSADINNVVKHKPDLGLQLGVTAGLTVSKKVRLLAGLQFNVSKYDIRAYTHPSEMATIALSTAAGGSNTVSATSNYRNTGGPKADWLRNLYISTSAPIGLEVRILGNRRNYFGVSGTMQPTYVLSNKSYLLSTDYKNYAKIPSLTRNWNMNAGFEMFAGISTGKLRWRVGPQVRYQVMSSYDDRYPIMEHLFDFGLKMGIMLNR